MVFTNRQYYKKGKNKGLKKTNKSTTKKILQNNKHSGYTNKEKKYVDASQEKRIKKLEKEVLSTDIIYPLQYPQYLTQPSGLAVVSINWTSPTWTNTSTEEGIYDNNECGLLFNISPHIRVPHLNATDSNREDGVPVLALTNKCMITKFRIQCRSTFNWEQIATQDVVDGPRYWGNSDIMRAPKLRYFICSSNTLNIGNIREQLKVLPLPDITYKRQIYRLDTALVINSNMYSLYKSMCHVLYEKTVTLKPYTVMSNKIISNNLEDDADIDTEIRYREATLTIDRDIVLNKVIKFADGYDPAFTPGNPNTQPDNFKLFIVYKFENSRIYDIMNNLESAAVTQPNNRTKWQLKYNLKVKV